MEPVIVGKIKSFPVSFKGNNNEPDFLMNELVDNWHSIITFRMLLEE